MVIPNKYIQEDYVPYWNLAQAITEIAVTDYKKVPTELNKSCLVSCLDVFYNFSKIEINNIIVRLDDEQTEKKK